MGKILVIEDEKNIRQSLMEILTYFSYEVSCAANGTEGILMAKENAPDLIICDVMMPGTDGFAVLKELKKDNRFSTPFVFLTAKVQSDDIARGKQLGAAAYLSKPFKSAELVKTIRGLLAADVNRQ